MALVAFQRSGDAAVARAKYDGKFIDGRECPLVRTEPPRHFRPGRPIKIEVVVDTASPAPAPTQPSLLGRLGGANLSVLPRDHAPNGAPP
jgi:THO complex subunit 4